MKSNWKIYSLNETKRFIFGNVCNCKNGIYNFTSSSKNVRYKRFNFSWIFCKLRDYATYQEEEIYCRTEAHKITANSNFPSKCTLTGKGIYILDEILTMIY